MQKRSSTDDEIAQKTPVLKFRNYKLLHPDKVSHMVPTSDRPSPSSSSSSSFNNNQQGQEEQEEEEEERITVETLVKSTVQETLDQDAMLNAGDSLNLKQLAPKKIDWDLKRALEKPLEKLERKTRVAMAELIRKRVMEEKTSLAEAVRDATLQ